METLVLPPRKRAAGTVRPPGSKSIANRALPLAALAAGRTRLLHLPDGDDVNLMRTALAHLGIRLHGEGSELEIEGIGRGFQAPAGADVSLFLGNSGTATRFLTALLAAGHGVFRLDGVARMRERPLGDLVEALRQLAAPQTRFDYEHRAGFLPLRLTAQGLEGGSARIRGDVSSQFTTGLLLALPLCRRAAAIEVAGTLASAPYVDLTVGIMRAFGSRLAVDGPHRFAVEKPAGYASPGTFAVEPDASSASYFLAAGAIGGGPVTVAGLGRDSAQGEIGFAEVLRRMGAGVEYGSSGVTVRAPAGKLQGIDADMDSMSDTGMTLAVTALFAQGPTVIRGVANWRHKETDRLAAMAAELRKVGAAVDENADGLIIRPPETLRPAEIETYDDHRMAMCFALAAFGGVPVTLRNPGCVRKTYPGFFRDFATVAPV